MATSKKPVLTKDQVKGIFADLQTIFTFNETLLKRLEERVGDWSQYQKLGDIFVDIVAFLKVYTNYVQNFNNSLALLSSISKKPVIAKFLRECGEDPRCKHLDLSAFLIMPVQRIPRYHLLLQELVKHTWPEHCDYEHLNEAMEKVKQLATFLNDKKREAEEMAETFARHTWIKGKELDVTPDRRFVREDTFTDVKKGAEMIIYMFNDLIVYGKSVAVVEPGKNKIKFKGQLTTIDCEVTEKPPVKSYKYCFSLGDTIYSAKTEEERTEYMEAVQVVKDLATSKLSSHLKETQKEDPADGASAEDVLRQRKKNIRSPTLLRATSLFMRGSSSHSAQSAQSTAPVQPSQPSQSTQSTQPAQPVPPTPATQTTQTTQAQKNPASRLSDDSTGRASTSSNGSLGSDVSDEDAEREVLMKSKNEILQRLLELPSDPKKDTKKSKNQRVQWEQELEFILRKLSEMDQHTNSPPVMAAAKESQASSSPISSPVSSQPVPSAGPSPGTSPGTPYGTSPSTPPAPPIAPPSLSSRSSPTVGRRPSMARNYPGNPIVVPLAAVARDNSRVFNSVRGYQPNPTPAHPPSVSRAVSTSSLLHTPSESPNPSPSPSPPTPKPALQLKLDTSARNHPAPATSPSSNPASTSNSPSHSPPVSPVSPLLRPVSPHLRPISPALTPTPIAPSPTPPSRLSATVHTSTTTSTPTTSTASTPATSPTHSPSFSRSPSLSPSPSPSLNNSPSLSRFTVRGSLTYEEISQKKTTLEMTKLEEYLSDAEFLRIFKQPREGFYKQPKWKQEQQKKENKLI